MSDDLILADPTEQAEHKHDYVEGTADDRVQTEDGRKYEHRDYQDDAEINVVDAIIAGYRRTLLISPTGTGKNHMTALILSNQKLREYLGVPEGEILRVMYFAHKHELLTQGVTEIGCLDGVELIPQSIFSEIPPEILEQGWHFSIHDEAHHEPMMSFQKKLEFITDTQMLGLTATPARGDKFSLKFDKVITAISREEAVRRGFIAPATVHSVVDMGMMDKPALLKDLVEGFGDRMENTLIYMKKKEQVHEVNKMLQLKGYRSVALVDCTKTYVEEVRRMFMDNELDFVVNCQKLDEGVDFKNVRGVVIARGVQSEGLLNQIIGRGARIDTPECHIWQFVDPLKDNLDACAIVGKSVDHYLYYLRAGKWEVDQMSSAEMIDNEVV